MSSLVAKPGDVSELALLVEMYSPLLCEQETWSLLRHYDSWLSRLELHSPVENVGPRRDRYSRFVRQPGPTSRSSYSLNKVPAPGTTWRKEGCPEMR